MREQAIEQTSIVQKALVGVASPAAGTWISFMSELEITLRVIALVLGCAVSLLSMWSIWRHRNDGRKHHKK